MTSPTRETIDQARRTLGYRKEAETLERRGWCVVPVPEHFLRAANVPYERGIDPTAGRSALFAPAWVYVLWVKITSSVSVTGLVFSTESAEKFRALQDNLPEQEAMLVEFALNDTMPRDARRASKNYAALLTRYLSEKNQPHATIPENDPTTEP